MYWVVRVHSAEHPRAWLSWLVEQNKIINHTVRLALFKRVKRFDMGNYTYQNKSLFLNHTLLLYSNIGLLENTKITCNHPIDFLYVQLYHTLCPTFKLFLCTLCLNVVNVYTGEIILCQPSTINFFFKPTIAHLTSFLFIYNSQSSHTSAYLCHLKSQIKKFY